jgi:hypothetical protein
MGETVKCDLSWGVSHGDLATTDPMQSARQRSRRRMDVPSVAI